MGLGSTDLPALSDEFGIDKYCNSMVQFIENCNTPMTISVQGTWGTGKTSFMKMVEARLKNCKFIEFNTWQFSQFEMDGDLSINLVKSLIDDMGLKDEQKKGINIAINAAKFTSSIVFEKLTGIGNLGGAAGEIVEKIGDAFSNQEVNPISAIKDIKKRFEKCVEDCKEANKVDRIVIFIDDLDRLEPRKAVELLEVLKNFLDCKSCVFVLAIDYDVVCRGVAAKYGTLDGNSALDRKKGKDFFDKIIQVPFKMPVAQYDTKNYLKSCLTGIVYNGKPLFKESDDFTSYYYFVEESIGTNPRTIKRLINSYQLLSLVVQFNKDIDMSECKLLLFATLCLQELDSAVYNAIVRRRNTLSGEMINCFTEADSESIKDKYPELFSDDIDAGIDIEKISIFMQRLQNAICEVDGAEVGFERFRSILSFSSVTSTDDTESDSIPFSVYKASDKTKEIINDFAKKFSSNDKLVEWAHENGIEWAEHTHKGINIMRLKMAMQKAYDDGALELPDKN